MPLVMHRIQANDNWAGVCPGFGAAGCPACDSLTDLCLFLLIGARRLLKKIFGRPATVRSYMPPSLGGWGNPKPE
jgi:hypothetical protein